MAGPMLEQAADAAPPADMPPEAMPDDNGAQQASPEEQELYNRFVSQGMLLTYSSKMFPKVLQMLDGGGDPVEGLAVTASSVVSRVMQAADAKGVKLPGDVVVHAGTELFQDLADLSTKARIHDFHEDRDGLESAYLRAQDKLRMVLQEGGRIDQQAAQGDFAKLQEMDQSGDLEAMFQKLNAEDGGDEPPPDDQQMPGGISAAMGAQ